MNIVTPLSVLVGAFALVQGAVAGNTWYPNGTWSVSRNTAIMNASMWSSEDGMTVCPAICADDDYVVRNQVIRFKDVSFGGHSLTMGELGQNGSSVMIFDGGWSNGFPCGGLILACGQFYNNSTAKAYYPIAGDLTVLSPADNPFALMASQYDDRYTVFNGPMSGENGTGLKVTNERVGNAEGKSNVRYAVLDASGYKGSVAVVAYGTTSYSGATPAIGFYLGTTELPGSVTVGRGATFGTYLATDTCTVGTLSLAAGSRISVEYDAANGTAGLVCADAATVEGPVDVFLNVSAESVPGLKIPLLKVPASTEVSESDFTLTLAVGDASKASLAFEPDGTGAKTLCVSFIEQVVLEANDDKTYNKWGASYPSAFEKPESWSDKKLPHGNAEYLIPNGCIFREIDNLALDYVFPGVSMKFAGGKYTTTLICGSHSLEVTNLVVEANAKLLLRTIVGNPLTLKGGIALASGGEIQFGGYANALSTVTSEISGGGTLRTVGEGGTGSAKGTLELTALNTNWTGRLVVDYVTETTRGYPGFWNGYYRLYVNDELNLGGTLPAFDFRALTLAGYGRLEPRRSLVLSAELNRGILVDGNGSFDVPKDLELTCNRTLTAGGTVYKEGEGTLTLGGSLKFLDISTDTAVDEVPSSGAPQFSLQAGTLKVGAAGACDGFQVFVANAAAKTGRIVIPVEAAPGSELALQGLRNVKAGESPFVLDEGLEYLPIGFDGQMELAEGDVRTNALVTVANSALAGVRGMIPQGLRPYSNVCSKVIEIPREGEATTTIACVTKWKPGMWVLIR